MLLIRLRQFLIIALLCSNMVLGLMSYSLLRQASSGYTELIGQSVPVLVDLHGITVATIRSYRAAVQVIHAKDADERNNCVARAEKLEHDSFLLCERYQRTPDLLNGERIDQPIATAAREYHETLAHYAELVRTNQLDEATAYRRSTLRASLDSYCALLDQRITTLEQRTKSLNQDYNQNHQTWRNILLTLGSWPLIAAVASLAIAVGMLVALLVSVFTPTLRNRQA